MARKIINQSDAGTSTKFGGDDTDYINKYLTGVDQSSTDSVTINTTTTFGAGKLVAKNIGRLADFVIYKDAGDSAYKALNTATGVIDSSNSSAATVIQYAIDNVPTAGGAIRLASGTFDLGTTGLTIPASGTKFFDFGGSGAGTSIIVYTGTGYALTITGTGSSLCSTKIHDMKFDGFTKTTGRHGIKHAQIGPVGYYSNLYMRNFDDAFTIYDSNTVFVEDIRITTANTGIRTLKGGVDTPPNTTFFRGFYISDCATTGIDLATDLTGASVVIIKDGVIENFSGNGIVATGVPESLLIENIYFEGGEDARAVSGVDVYLKGIDSTFGVVGTILRNLRGRGNSATPDMANMIKIDWTNKVLIENCMAVAYSQSMILLNKNAEYKLNIVNPLITEATPFLLAQSTAITTATGRLAGSVRENRTTGYIAYLPAGAAVGDIVVLASSGRFVATAGVADQNNCAVVMYPSVTDDTPGVVAASGIIQINSDAAVTAGDIITSSTTAHKAHTNNNQNDGRKIIATSMETIGAAGLFWAELSTAAGGSPVVAEALQNKTIDGSANTLIGVDQDPIIRRSGRYLPVSTGTTITGATAVGLLEGILRDHVPTSVGTPTVTWDATEGLVINWVGTAVSNQANGLVSPTGANGITRRAFPCHVRIRWKIDAVASSVSRMYFGFTSASALPVSDTPLATTDHGVIVGFKSTSTNFEIYHNDGATSVTTDNVTGPIAKNTSFHTIDISWPASGNITVTFDGVAQVISTDLPATGTNLFFFAEIQSATAAIRTGTLKGVWIEAV